MSEFPAPPRVHVIHVSGADPTRDAIVRKLDEQADLCVHEDPARNGCMWNWLQALECAANTDTDTDTASWSVIVSDDADPLPGWQQHVERACTYSPQPFLGLTHFGQYGQKLVEKNLPYGEGLAVVWGGAIAYHRSMVSPLAKWATRLYEQTKFPHDDSAVAAFARMNGVRTAMTARAIFGQPHLPSLIGHGGAVRSPAATITNSPPLSYRSTPRSGRVSRGSMKEISALAEGRWDEL